MRYLASLFFTLSLTGLLPSVDLSQGLPDLYTLSGSGVQCVQRSGDPGRGRGLVALRDISGGSRIFCEDPFAFSPTVLEENHVERSHHTLKMPSNPDTLVQCKGCQFARYTSTEEQRLASPIHKDECPRIARCIHHGHTPSPILLILSRILARKRREAENRALEGEGETYKHVLALADHYGRWPDDQMAMFAQVERVAVSFFSCDRACTTFEGKTPSRSTQAFASEHAFGSS